MYYKRIPLHYLLGLVILYQIWTVYHFNLNHNHNTQEKSIPLFYEDDNTDIATSKEKKGGTFPSGTKIDGTFNTHEVIYVAPKDISSSQVYSQAHCIGETFTDLSWTHRSCRYSHMCFDMEEKEFVVFQSPSEQTVQQALQGHKLKELITFSSSLNTTVSLGGINNKWTWRPDGAHSLEWKPKILTDSRELLKSGYYQLAPGKLFLPFHSFAAINIGHMMWDDFLPIYMLRSAFQLDGNDADMVLVRYILKNRDRALWGTCDLRDSNLIQCKHFFRTFLPLLGILPESMRSTNDSLLIASDGNTIKSKYVCAETGLAGMGMFSDHGLKTHGWIKKDYDLSHNIGRATVFKDFRNFMMNNIHMDPGKTVKSFDQYKIIFSLPTSKDRVRQPSMVNHLEATKQEFAENDAITTEMVDFSTRIMKEQVRIVSEASILVAVCGGGAVTSLFLPKGSTLILFYPDYSTSKKHPARLDWDYFNNLSDYRVHWLPISTMRSQEDINIFIQILKHEFELIMHTNI